MKFPGELYVTPEEEWGGDCYYFSAEDMLKTIQALKKLGDEWEDISMDDCEVYDLVEVYGKYAIYRFSTHRIDRFFVFGKPGQIPDTFTLISSHDTLEEAREDIADFSQELRDEQARKG